MVVAPRDIPDTQISLRSALSSLDFLNCTSGGKFCDCCQTNSFYVGTEKLPAAVNHDHSKEVKRLSEN